MIHAIAIASADHAPRYGISGTMTGSWSEADGIRCTARVHTHDLCRKLVELGRAGSLVLNDAATGKPRLVVRDIAHAAKWTVEERDDKGMRLVRWRANPLAARCQAAAGETEHAV